MYVPNRGFQAMSKSFANQTRTRTPARMALAIAAIAAAMTVLPAMANAGERLNDAALGALSGALVGGPVGLVAGGVIGYTAGPHISRGMGLKHNHRDHTADNRRAEPRTEQR
jgi:hypothetical protein